MTYPNAVAATEKLFETSNARRVVAKAGAKYFICSRSKARRIKAKIIAKNY